MSSISNKNLRDFLDELPSLDPMAPDEAVKRYLDYRGDEITRSTREEYEAELRLFAAFCGRHEIANLNDLSGRDIDDYRHWRRNQSSDEGTLSTKTMRDVMYLIRNFVSYLSSIEAVPTRLEDKIEIPNLADGDGVRDTKLDTDRLNRIISYVHKHEYATREHVIWLLLSTTGRRLGGIHSIDLCDLHLDIDEPYIEFRHNPPETRLKNANKGEGPTSIDPGVAEVVKAYVDHNRKEVETDSGRNPLLTTYNGRIAKSTIRQYIYKWSRPCMVGGECPHDRDPSECVAAQTQGDASKCPSTRSAHSLRHTYITQKLRDGVPKGVLSDRCDVGEDVLDKHYDERTAEEKLERRREILAELRDDKEGVL